MNKLTDKEIIIKRIKKIIETSDLCITKKDIARAAGVSERSVYNVLNDVSTLEVTIKVARALGVSVAIISK